MMRNVLVLLVSIAGCASSAGVQLPVALPTTATARELPPTNAARAEPATDGAWARSFPRAQEFAELDVRARATLLLTWRVGPHRQLEKRGVPEDDFAENFGSTVDLVVEGAVVTFGGIPGNIVAPELPYCARLGWHKADGPVVFPPYVVSSLTLDIPQRVDDFMIVRDGATLHVLHRSTSEETTCNKTKEGPLDICAGEPWSIRADLHLGGHPALYERVEQAGAPCDCGAPLGEGTRLIAPARDTTKFICMRYGRHAHWRRFALREYARLGDSTSSCSLDKVEGVHKRQLGKLALATAVVACGGPARAPDAYARRSVLG